MKNGKWKMENVLFLPPEGCTSKLNLVGADVCALLNPNFAKNRGASSIAIQASEPTATRIRVRAQLSSGGGSWSRVSSQLQLCTSSRWSDGSRWQERSLIAPIIRIPSSRARSGGCGERRSIKELRGLLLPWRVALKQKGRTFPGMAWSTRVPAQILRTMMRQLRRMTFA